ncbi:hypothetical protein JL475_37925 [Streptomyces sp. M2CJ-2]|uniref:hypothetical protein n=1 Tax=Streptomyces sp. M2CJ-2 TaxID=2803948 RepID=UPI001925849B|nr:hypothetical protein [Streptomyces sp. M2CJ-2]MBL3671558.1 hypothetical protein [Streptomyces sp. M2CJ-2]
MPRPSRYPIGLRRRAVHMVAEVCGDHPNETAALQGGRRQARHRLPRDTAELAEAAREPRGDAAGNDCKIAPSTYYAHKKCLGTPSARSVRDKELKERIQEVYTSNYRAYGARKI